MTLTVDDRELIERLKRKVQALPATGGAGVSAAATDGLGNPVETKYFSYITDDGKRLANPDGPAAADRLQSLLSDRDKLEHALKVIADPESWGGFSPMPQIERMRDLARAALTQTEVP